MSFFVDKDGEPNLVRILSSIIVGIVVIILVSWLWPFGTVSAGARGVVLNWGAVSNQIKSPGLYFRVPVMQKVVEMDVQVQKESTTATAASKDLQNVKAEVALNYHLDPQQVAIIYKNVGDEATVNDRIIAPAMQEAVKAVTANYTAEELITKRQEVTNLVQTQLTTKLQSYGLIVDAFNVTNFDFSDQFNAAVEAKVTAQQNALAAENKLQQVQYEAEQTVTSAKAQAEAIQIQAQAINAQGGADYVQLQAIAKWDGHLPAQMIPGSTVPFLNLSK